MSDVLVEIMTWRAPAIEPACYRTRMSIEDPPGRAQDWPSCDEDIAAFIHSTVELLAAELGGNIVGVYLHGSLAMGSYFRPKSDLDLLVVSARELPVESRRRLARALVVHMRTRPTVGNLELSVITADTARAPEAPVLYELHVSAAWEDAILADQVDFAANGTDPDLPAHLTHIRQRGVCLLGAPVEEAFGEIAWDAFLAAVDEDAAWVLADRNLWESPFYGVLNICRVLQLRQQEYPRVHSKDEAARWALGNIPAGHHDLVRLAWTAYRSDDDVDPSLRRTAGLDWPEAELMSFRDFARSQLNVG